MAEISVIDFEKYDLLLPPQYDNSPELIKLLQIYLSKLQELNVEQQEFNRVSTDLLVATGKQLDLIGELLGASREGRSDEDYRSYIRFVITRNAGSGTSEDLISFLSFVTKADTIKIWEHFPAAIIAQTDGDTINSTIAQQLDEVCVGGVSAEGILHVETDLVFTPVEHDRYQINSTNTSNYSHVSDSHEVAAGILPEHDAALQTSTRGVTPEFYSK